MALSQSDDSAFQIFGPPGGVTPHFLVLTVQTTPPSGNPSPAMSKSSSCTISSSLWKVEMGKRGRPTAMHHVGAARGAYPRPLTPFSAHVRHPSPPLAFLRRCSPSFTAACHSSLLLDIILAILRRHSPRSYSASFPTRRGCGRWVVQFRYAMRRRSMYYAAEDVNVCSVKGVNAVYIDYYS